MFEQEQVDKLQEKLKASNTFQRERAGIPLTYIYGWHAIAEANEVFGFDGWARETISMLRTEEGMGKTKDGYDQHVVSYIAKVRITAWAGERPVVREGTGSGTGMDRYSLGGAHESAVKEAETDATKRALATFGWRFGLALYDKSRKHVSGDPVRSEGVSGDKGHPLIDEFKRLATIIGEQEVNPDYCYQQFLSYMREGKELYVGPANLDKWGRGALSDKRRKWLENATAKMIARFPELAEEDSITDKDIPF